MSADLYQIVDMRRPEADGLEGLVEIDEGGRHVLPLVEDDASCDMCGEAEAELIEIDDGVVVAEQATYTVETAGGSGVLCQEHLAQQPTHAGFKAVGGEV